MRAPEPVATRGAALALAAALLAAPAAHGGGLDFTLHKDGTGGATLLVVGGIQGDEPGGFNAASLLVTHYRILDGTLWVVPNLNFESILRRSRGVYGDMNRKFPSAPASDPDYARVEKIKSIITDAQVDYVLNLHDGSGFFRHRREDGLRGPHRWGQSIIIDQEEMAHPDLGDLAAMARRVAREANRSLIEPDHALHVKNTRTREGNREMAKTLTYFAINRGQPAAGLEASKSLPTHARVYYHLLMVEAYMRRLGITFERRFALDPESIREAIDNNVRVAFYDDRLFLELVNARTRLGYVPLKKGADLEFTASSPLVAITPVGGEFRVRYGNRRVTELHPQPFEYDRSIDSIALRVDGQHREVRFGSLVDVGERFSVEPMRGYRVNVIGWRKPGGGDESGAEIRRRALVERFSVDRAATTFRVEVYSGRRFSGMVLVRFADDKRARASQLTGSTS